MDEMDDLCDQVRELCAGKSVEEIEEAIASSTIAGVVSDPKVLAQYFFDIAGGAQAGEEEPEEETGDEPPPQDEELD